VRSPASRLPHASDPAVIRLDRVTYRYPARRREQVGEAVAVDAVSLAVLPGQLFGILGPNGAGKTTLLRLLCARLRPVAGRVRVLGWDPVTEPGEVRRCLGAALGGERSLYWRLTGRENLLYAAALYDLPSRMAAERIAALLRLMEMEDQADVLVERYSTGMRQRLALARALVADPPVLVLDEPTAGLDPRAVAMMRRLLVGLRDDRARAIVMATHNVADAERLCDEVAILDRGRLLACGAPDAVRRQHAPAGGDRAAPSLEDVFLAVTGRAFVAANAARGS
jgi:ABC-2 type transport system ATP-binding protein